MVTDPLFYRLFLNSPETLFLLLGMSLEQAMEMAARYQYDAIEFKQTSHRTDGVFRPTEPGLPLYFVEVQFYRLPSVYADLLAKAFTYLKQNDPAQPFQGIVFFATKSLEPGDRTPYQPFIDAGVIRRFYLDELLPQPGAPLGLAILHLLSEPEPQAPTTARDLIERAKQEIADEALRWDLIQLIETIIVYKLPKLRFEEIQAMLKVDDIRKTRVYLDAQEEGRIEARDQERQRQRERDRNAIGKLAALNIAPEKIAEVLELDIETVRAELAKP